jgi:hypothetical protein
MTGKLLVDLEQRPVTDKVHHCALLEGKLTLLPCEVVAIWGVLLGVLAAVSAGFGSNTLVLAVAGSAAGGVLLLAGVVWLHWRLRRRGRCLRQPTRAGGVILFAVAVMLAWLAFAFGGWLLLIAGVPLLAAAGREVSARRWARALNAAAMTRPPARQVPAGLGKIRQREPGTDLPGQFDPEEWEWDSRQREPALSGAPR